MRNEFDANRALQPLPLAMRLQAGGWQVGANALQPVKPPGHASGPCQREVGRLAGSHLCPLIPQTGNTST